LNLNRKSYKEKMKINNQLRSEHLVWVLDHEDSFERREEYMGRRICETGELRFRKCDCGPQTLVVDTIHAVGI